MTPPTTTIVPGWPDFQAATFSSETNCVAVDRTRRRIRDKKNMSAGELRFADLGTALAAVKSGRFDLPA